MTQQLMVLLRPNEPFFHLDLSLISKVILMIQRPQREGSKMDDHEIPK